MTPDDSIGGDDADDDDVLHRQKGMALQTHDDLGSFHSKLSSDRQVPTVVRSCIADDDMLMCLHATDARTFVPVEYTNTVGLGPSSRQAKLCLCLPTVTRSCIEALRRSDRCVPSAKRFGRLTFIMIRWNPVEFI